MTWTLWEGLGFPVSTSIIVPQTPLLAIRSGLPPREAVLPLRVKRFWFSVKTVYSRSSQCSRLSLSRAVCFRLPADQVECAGDPIPTPSLVLGPEPSSPLAGVLAGQELGEPGYPDVGAVP